MPFRNVQSGSLRFHVVYLTVVVALLAVSGVAIVNSIDLSVSLAYRDQELYEHRKLNEQLMQALPKISAQATREEIIQALEGASSIETYTKDGCTWVGWVGLKFSAVDRLEHVSPSWSYGASDPCFPE